MASRRFGGRGSVGGIDLVRSGSIYGRERRSDDMRTAAASIDGSITIREVAVGIVIGSAVSAGLIWAARSYNWFGLGASSQPPAQPPVQPSMQPPVQPPVDSLPNPAGSCRFVSSSTFHLRPTEVLASVGPQLASGVELEILGRSSLTRGQSRMYRVRVVADDRTGFMFLQPSEVPAGCAAAKGR